MVGPPQHVFLFDLLQDFRVKVVLVVVLRASGLAVGLGTWLEQTDSLRKGSVNNQRTR